MNDFGYEETDPYGVNVDTEEHNSTLVQLLKCATTLGRQLFPRQAFGHSRRNEEGLQEWPLKTGLFLTALWFIVHTGQIFKSI